MTVADPPQHRQGGRSRASDAVDLSRLARGFAGKGGAFALFEFNYQAVHAVAEVRDGDSVSRTEVFQSSLDIRLTVGGDPAAAEDLVQRLQDAFTPEKVAGRIADFALKGRGEDDPFRPVLLEAVERGWRKAMELLGPLDDAAKAPLEESLRLVRERFAALEESSRPAQASPG